MPEGDVAADLSEPHRIPGIGCDLLRIQQGKDPLSGCQAGLEHVNEPAQLAQRLAELTAVLHERLHAPDGQRAAGHLDAANDGDGDVVQVGYERHGRHDDAGDELGAERRLVEPFVPRMETFHDALLLAECLHHVLAGEHLLDVAVDFAGGFPLGLELHLRALGDQDGHHGGDGNREHGDHGQQRGDPQHHAQHPQDGQH